MNHESQWEDLFRDLKIDCKNCFGLCCVSLYFSKSEGFPTDKEAKEPCINLEPDFRCKVHSKLLDKGLKGCISYDCFGAGQKVSRDIYKEKDWLQNPELANEIFEVFCIINKIHEMLWYLKSIFSAEELNGNPVKNDLGRLIKETENLTNLNPSSILNIDIVSQRYTVNSILKKARDVLIEGNAKVKNPPLGAKKEIAGRLDLVGRDLKKTSLNELDLAGALLMAADVRGNNLKHTNLIGADLRDADIRGANLSQSLFITQAQINTARGDSSTILSPWIDRPANWEK